MDKFIVALSAYMIRSELLAFDRGVWSLSALKVFFGSSFCCSRTLELNLRGFMSDYKLCGIYKKKKQNIRANKTFCASRKIASSFFCLFVLKVHTWRNRGTSLSWTVFEWMNVDIKTDGLEMLRYRILGPCEVIRQEQYAVNWPPSQ